MPIWDYPRLRRWLAGMLACGLLQAQEATVHPVDLQKPLSARQPLIVGVTTDTYPWAFLDEQGQPLGFSVDILDAAARAMELRIQRVAVPGEQYYERFRLGEFDLLQVLIHTTDRETNTDFSVPFLTLQSAIFVQKQGSPIRRLEDFNGRKFAVSRSGNSAEKFFQDHHLQVERVFSRNAEEALRLVNTGEVAGAFMTHLTGVALMERADFENVAVFANPATDYDIPQCFAVHKGDAVLLARVNEGLA